MYQTTPFIGPLAPNTVVVYRTRGFLSWASWSVLAARETKTQIIVEQDGETLRFNKATGRVIGERARGKQIIAIARRA